jgi:hypothetical protein
MKPWLITAWAAVSLTSLLTALALGSLNRSPKAKSYSQALKYVPCDILLPSLPTKLPIDYHSTNIPTTLERLRA